MLYEIRFFKEDGALALLRTMQCEDDDAALERLAQIRHPHALELWQGDRRVWRFEDAPL